jgi:beta-phosphoglucomutase
MIEAVIFHWDGTLADTKRAIVCSFENALKSISIQVPAEYVERRMGIGAAETFREILKFADRPVDEKIVKQLVEQKSQVQIELANKVEIFEGSKELLAALKCRVKLGLASMNNRTVVLRLLEMQGILDCFDVVLTADSVSTSKPNPEIFPRTAAQLKASPVCCVVLEDSLFGVRAAKAAGMGCIAVTTGVYSSEELAEEKPDLTVKTLKDPRILSYILQ